MSNLIEEVQHIINFLQDNEIETGSNRGVKPLEEMLAEYVYLKDKAETEKDDFINRDRWE